MSKKDSRFIVVYDQTALTTGAKLLVDRETNVTNLFYQQGSAGGLTPLLDREGRPVTASLPPED